MTRKSSILPIVLSSIFVISICSFVFSQNAVAQDSASPSVEPASIPEPATDIFPSYLQSLEQYRQNEQQFKIAKQQYLQLGTLAALEEVTQRSQQAQLTRNTILDYYFQLLMHAFSRTDGIELGEKNLELDRITFILSFLKTQKASLTIAETYQELDTLNTVLGGNQENIETVAYETLILKKMGQLQTSIDHLKSVSSKVYEGVEKTPENDRAYAEITRTIEQAELELNQTLAAYLEETNATASKSDTYQDYMDRLNAPYIKIKKTLNYIKELRS